MNKIDPETFDAIMRKVRKPSTYLGTELNSVHKNHEDVKASIALVFPDLYEIGTSHLGLKILYSLINVRDEFCAERAFAPGDDFAEAITETDTPYMSLETKTPLAGFDMVGFTIPYELSYTTILWILDLAKIPLRSKDRADSHPLIIGGGAGVYNPEPVAEFFDLFVLGDGEEAILEIMAVMAELKGSPRSQKLERLAQIAGVYVPSFFNAAYHDDGKLESVTPASGKPPIVNRVSLPTLAESPFPEKLVVPFGRPIQDRLNVEIDRGCTQGCRFCQAGTTYRPARERTPEQVMEIFGNALDKTGYGEISLTSLSAGDYSKIEPLLNSLMDRYAKERISVSLPSLRPGSVTQEVIDQIGRVRRTGFTITAEAGTERLRNVLNKKLTEDEIIATAQRLLAGGWRSLKLYFMIGLPTETMEDVEAIYTLSRRLDRLQEKNNMFKNISVSVSNFVPKAHTAFQWFGQDTIENLTEKKEILFALIKKSKRLKLKWHDAKMSHMEAVFSRGDRRLADSVEAAYRLGARLDPWTERFNFGLWMKAFEEAGLDPAFYANRDFEKDETLPWDHIGTGLNKKYFLRELDHGLKGEVTEDCKTEKCIACGLDPETCFEPYDTNPPQIEEKEAEPGEEVRFFYRLGYHVRENAKYFSNIEVQNIIRRALRIIKAPVAYSQGFSPHPRISFGPGLPVGIESADEWLDAEFHDYWEPWSITVKLNRALPEGIVFVEAKQLRPGEKSIGGMIAGFKFRINLEGEHTAESVTNAASDFLALQSFEIGRRGGEKTIDIRPMVSGIEIEPESADIIYTTIFDNKGMVRPGELLAALFPDEPVAARRVVKLSVLWKQD